MINRRAFLSLTLLGLAAGVGTVNDFTRIANHTDSVHESAIRIGQNYISENTHLSDSKKIEMLFANLHVTKGTFEDPIHNQTL